MKRSPVLALVLLIACGHTEDGDHGDDADGDSISDADEGRASGLDTDGDGTPDYEDEDSDNDGILDALEAGDADVATTPIDSDQDGVPDVRDTDSDNNGRTDDVDGVDDLDGDGVEDFRDPDDDGDLIGDIDELGANPVQPVDTDDDGTADFHDTDSDDDTISDLDETYADYDNDGLRNYLDLDSDGDCIPDGREARGTPPADSDGDHHPDYLDRDSDGDGILDGAEDANCNGTRDGDESSSSDGDTDDDGASDLVEVTTGTDPNDSASNPQANGDLVFVEPYQLPQSPLTADLGFSTKLKTLDLYVLLDRSGSMLTEITSIKNNLALVISHLTCPPSGTGTVGDCIPDLWAGAGTIGYQGAGAAAYQNWVDLSPTPSFASLPLSEPAGSNTSEPLSFAAFATVTGQGGANYGMANVPARATCNGSPAATAGHETFGYPCFRRDALPVVLLVTDEPPISTGDTYKTPDWSAIVKPAYQAAKARLVGILGSDLTTGTADDLRLMATDTGAIDAANGNAPFVFDGAGANAAPAIETGISQLTNGLPLDMNTVSRDDASDAVDALAAFVDHLETSQLGTAQCASGLTDVDTNSDTHSDTFIQVRAGTPLCWKVVAKQNTTVMPTAVPQLFHTTVSVYGDGITELDQRDVYFLVPPANPDEPI